MQYKLKASSISATDDNVYLATHSATGYGFSVWKTDADFENGQAIISDLSGCCGQMDVKVNGDALFVAENSRHRVCHYDTSGKLVGSWGTASRTGIEGFGSCCNPMNVAFGPGGVIYTAEDDTGRIKRYTPEANCWAWWAPSTFRLAAKTCRLRPRATAAASICSTSRTTGYCEWNPTAPAKRRSR